jgi:heme A synthase
MAQDVLIPFITIFAVTLFVIGMLSWRRTENPKIATVSLAFFVFFLKGVIMSIGLYTPYMSLDISAEFVLAFDVILVLDLVILTLLYLAIFRK